MPSLKIESSFNHRLNSVINYAEIEEMVVRVDAYGHFNIQNKKDQFGKERVRQFNFKSKFKYDGVEYLSCDRYFKVYKNHINFLTTSNDLHMMTSAFETRAIREKQDIADFEIHKNDIWILDTKGNVFSLKTEIKYPILTNQDPAIQLFPSLLTSLASSPHPTFANTLLASLYLPGPQLSILALLTPSQGHADLILSGKSLLRGWRTPFRQINPVPTKNKSSKVLLCVVCCLREQIGLVGVRVKGGGKRVPGMERFRCVVMNVWIGSGGFAEIYGVCPLDEKSVMVYSGDRKKVQRVDIR